MDGGSGDDMLTGGAGDEPLKGVTAPPRGRTGDVNFTLTNSSLTGLGSDTLQSIEEAYLTGGPATTRSMRRFRRLGDLVERAAMTHCGASGTTS